MKKTPKSLEDFWYCLIGTCVQIYCLYEGFLKLHKYNSQSWQPYKKPDIEICVYAFFLCLSILLLPLFIITSLLKIGSYANDNFKFGFDLEQDRGKLSSSRHNHNHHEHINNERRLNQSRISLNQSQRLHAAPYHSNRTFLKSSALSSSSFTSTLTTISAVNNHAHTSATFNLRKFFGCHLVSPKVLWKYSMPVASILHIIMAFCFLYPNVLLVAKEIEYGFRPKGYIHYNEMDFVFSRPLKRLGEKHDFNELKFELITSSLDDIEQVNYEPSVSLEFGNYVFALLAFSLKYASTLWYLNKFYSIIFSIHIIIYGCVSALTLGAFQVLYKFESAFRTGIRDTRHVSSVFELPFVTNRVALNLIFFTICLLLLISCIPIYTLGICQFDLKFNRLKTSFSRFLITSNSMSPHHNHHHHHHHDHHNQDDFTLQSIASGTHTNLNNRRKSSHKKLNPFFSSYRHHIWALLTLVLICILSAICVYDFICLYQLTTDVVPLWAAISHIIFILWYLILWLILTFKTKWRFEFTQLFKLSYWQYLNKTHLSPLTISSRGSSSSSTDSNAAHDCESVCSRPRRAHVSSSLTNLPSNIDGYLEPYEASIDGSVYENELLMKPVTHLMQKNFRTRSQQMQSSLRRLAPVLEAINPDSPRHHDLYDHAQSSSRVPRRSSSRNHVYESTRKLASHSAENILATAAAAAASATVVTTASSPDNYDLLDFSLKAANQENKQKDEILPLKIIHKNLKTQDSDSGRHSMTDSPCSIPSNNDNSKQLKQPGMFSSKCTLSTGTNISQTMHKFNNINKDTNDVHVKQQQQQQQQQNDDLLRKSLYNLTSQQQQQQHLQLQQQQQQESIMSMSMNSKMQPQQQQQHLQLQPRSLSRNAINFSSKIISEL